MYYASRLVSFAQRAQASCYLVSSVALYLAGRRLAYSNLFVSFVKEHTPATENSGVCDFELTETKTNASTYKRQHKPYVWHIDCEMVSLGYIAFLIPDAFARLQ
jgi:hypothetical protein